uniref:Uncharacterized protein n=1 Tax=Panagrolaimus superbus TaxID=310955 RepID=A0A914ZHZ3_9BILA
MATNLLVIGSSFSYVAKTDMENSYSIEALTAGIGILTFSFTLLYFGVSKLVKHEPIFDEKIMIFLLITFDFVILKVATYKFLPPKTATLVDFAKLLYAAARQIFTLVIPLIFSKNDWLVCRVTDWMPKLTTHV